ncbi:MAG: tetratricopeptide repeat protein [Pseudomonadota bacterium]
MNSIPTKLITTLFAGAMLTAATSVTAADALSHFEPAAITKAERALDRGLTSQALDILNKAEATASQPRDRAEVYGLRCEAHLERGDALAAINACQAAIETRGGVASWRFHNNLGVAHLMLGDTTLAETAFRIARTLNPRETAPRRNLSLLADLTVTGDAQLGMVTPSRR